MSRKTSALLVTTIIICLGTSASAIKIGFVDLQRALNTVKEGKKAINRLKRLFKKMKRTLDKKQKAVKAFQKQLKKQSLVLTESAKKKKLEDYRKMLIELQQLYIGKQRKINKLERRMKRPILNKMGLILQKIGNTENYTMIFEKTESSILFAQSHLDLTNQLIRMYNMKKKSRKRRKRKKR